MADSLPIGIFDSGIGGLTVVKEILKVLPKENIIYLGDTGRVPYGTRDNQTINKFSSELVSFMLKKRVKAIVVACNTMSAVSISNIIKASNGTPIIDVIKPTVEFALNQKSVKSIGVIGTWATINSHSYVDQITQINKSIRVYEKSCPLFVPLVEEGFSHSSGAYEISKNYLKYFDNKDLDSIILGCTHYPMLKGVIRKSLRRRIKIIDSAFPTAEKLKKVLKENNLLNLKNDLPDLKFYVTDNPARSFEIANIFFNNKFPGKIEKITLA